MAVAPNKHLCLEHMPLLVLEAVCDYLPKQDVLAFSLVNSVCYNAASRRRLESVNVEIRNTTLLKQMDLMLSTRKCGPYVRRLFIVEPHVSENYGFSQTPIRFGDWLARGPESGQQEQQSVEFWGFLGQFLSRSLQITDLHFDCDETIPSYLLIMLQHHHPRCRLHVKYFSFRGTNTGAISLDEYALATSPCLYDIKVQYPDNLSGLEETIMRMVAGRAPNLKHVSMHPMMTFGYTGSNAIMDLTDMLPDDGKQSGKGSLKSLSLTNAVIVANLEAWDRHTKLELLHSLCIDAEMSLHIIELLASMARNDKFQSLRKLTLCLLTANEIPQYNQLAVDKAASNFFWALPPALENVEVSGFMERSVVDAILNRHGPNLRNLRIQPFYRLLEQSNEQSAITTGHLQELATNCPRLTDLKLTIPRSEGDEHEVAFYRALGNLPRLRRLGIELDCSQVNTRRRAQLEPTKKLPGTTVSIENIRKMFINVAVDKKLAASIFHLISSPCLEELTIRVYGGGNFGFGTDDGDLRDVMYWLSRDWVCRRNTWEGHDAKVVVEEIKKASVEGAGRYLNGDDAKIFWFGEIWEGLWPKRSGEWKNDWFSFPLASVLD